MRADPGHSAMPEGRKEGKKNFSLLVARFLDVFLKLREKFSAPFLVAPPPLSQLSNDIIASAERTNEGAHGDNFVLLPDLPANAHAGTGGRKRKKIP